MADSPSRNTGAHVVYAELKRQILSLDLKPGARIYEPAMAEALQVSRTPLREAIRRLISENLLEQQPTGGVLVPALDEAAISELYEVRAAMESLMARQACLKATAADIEALHGILERNAAMVQFADEAMKQGMSLHAKIAEMAGNSWARRFHDQISSQMERYRHFTNSTAGTAGPGPGAAPDPGGRGGRRQARKSRQARLRPRHGSPGRGGACHHGQQHGATP